GDGPSSSELCVDAVDGRLVCLAAGPHRSWVGRHQERPAIEPWVRLRERSDEVAVAPTEPFHKYGIGWPRADELIELDVQWFKSTLDDDCRGPPLDASQVAEEVPDEPVGTTRDRGVQPRGGRGYSQSRTFDA